jgi:hypothetical protein
MSHFRIRHREGGIGHRHTFSLSRASLGVCCALIACCVVAETLLRRQSGHVLSYLLIPCLALVSLALLPCMPAVGRMAGGHFVLCGAGLAVSHVVFV